MNNEARCPNGKCGFFIPGLTVTWDGTAVSWQAINKNADSGAVIYDTGVQNDTFGVAGTPCQIRLDTGTCNNGSRRFGTTDVLVTDTSGPPPPNQAPAFTVDPFRKSNSGSEAWATNEISLVMNIARGEEVLEKEVLLTEAVAVGETVTKFISKKVWKAGGTTEALLVSLRLKKGSDAFGSLYTAEVLLLEK